MYGPKGYVIVDKELNFTKSPGQPAFVDYDLKEDYFNALKYRMVTVIDVAVSGDSYLVMADGEKSGTFIWEVDKRDTISELIPYEVLHPNEPSIEKILDIIKRITEGKMTDEDAEVIFQFLANWKQFRQ